MKITLSTSGVVGINVINKLFDIGYVPRDLDVWCASSDAELTTFCQRLKIPVTVVDCIEDFDNVTVRGELLLSIVGIPLLIPDSIIDQFCSGAINLHPADTEKYRGRWMVSWCLINNESQVGYTWHYMNNQFDTGNILLKQHFDIAPTDTALSLNARIFSHAVYHLNDMLALVGTPGQPPTTLGKYYNKSVPHNGKIHPSWEPGLIDRFIRAMYHPPYLPAVFEHNGTTHYINTFEEFVTQNI